MACGEKFSCYVKPLIPITAEAQKVTGISWNGTEMTVKGLPVDAFSNSRGSIQISRVFEKV